MTAVLYYGFFLGLAALVSLEDWRDRKIRNRLILIGAGVCAAGLLVLLVNSALGVHRLRFGPLGEYYLPLRFYPQALLHLALSLAAAVVLWKFSVWPAGDAKFYALASFFLVLIDPNIPGFPFLLFLLLLINIFVPAGAVFAADALVNLIAKAPRLGRVEWGKSAKAALETLAIRARECWPYRGEYFMLAVNLVAFFLILQTAQARWLGFLREPWRSLAVFVLMFALWDGIVAALRRRVVGLVAFEALLLGAFYCVLRARWDAGAMLLQALRMTLNFGMFLSMGRVLFHWLIERDSRRELLAAELKAGDVLSDRTWELISGDKELARGLDERFVDGLTPRDAQTLRERLKDRVHPEYAIYHTIPFAFWIFLGVLLTVKYRGSVVALIAAQLPRIGGWTP